MRLVALVLLAALSGACVATAPARPTRSETMGGPPPPPSDQRTAAGLLVPGPKTGAEPAPAPDRTGRKVWVRGYWHWDGVRYVWVGGHWESAKPGYTWHRSYPADTRRPESARGALPPAPP